MPLLILESLAANIGFVVVALALGEPVLRLAERVIGAETRPPSLIRFGTALLVGFGACAYAGVVLGAVHLFRWQAFVVVGVLAVVFARSILVGYARAFRWPRSDVVILLASAIGLVVAVAQWLAALAPSEATDELAYHLPEAHTLADGHVLHLALGTDRIFGNLPTLVETLYGEALTIRGTALAHLLHLSILFAFVLLAVGVVRALWGGRAAALAGAGILLYSDLLYNATTAYVDAAEASFEAGAVLLLVLWFVRRDPAHAAGGALLVGLALSVKYNALVVAALGALLIASAKDRRLFIGLCGIVVVTCGYWYGKNLVQFGNPIYPLVFGHPGVSDATYSYFVRNIHSFGPRTLLNFVEIPTRFAGDANITALLGFAIAPLALFARGPRRAAVLLLVYVVVYATYWFWVATHQTRFLYAAVVITIVLAAAALGAVRGVAGLAAATVLALALGIGAQHKTNAFNLHLRSAADSVLDTPKARYTLGLESRSAYLHRYFGCQVDAVNELAARGLRGAVALWDLSPNPGYPRANELEPIKVTAATTAGVRAQLHGRGIRFALTQGMPVEQLSSNPAARPILRAAKRFWHTGDCTLYRLP
ncbi:MAG TPA: hypothetical protein VLE97_04060 [Gaiellaceae bacterium]|nr:hypothetical protein [Gaiellaceae bacterium]